MGAKVIATSSTDSKFQTAKKLGASELINYKTTPDWAAEVLRLTDGKGADLVADVGGSATLEQSIKSLRQGGTACVVGQLATPKPFDVVMPLMIGIKTCMSSSNGYALRSIGVIPILTVSGYSERDSRLQYCNAREDGRID